MDISHIKSLISEKESKILECKKSTTQLKSAMQSLCGFLNQAGGTVLIGITPDYNIIGQMVGDKTQQEIAHALTLFEPHPAAEVLYVSVEKDSPLRVIVLIATPNRVDQPYTFSGRAYQRSENTTVLMPRTTQEALLQRRGSYSRA